MLLHAPQRPVFTHLRAPTQCAVPLRVPGALPKQSRRIPSHNSTACRAQPSSLTPAPQQPDNNVPSLPSPEDSDESSQPSNPIVRAILWLRACVQGALLVLLPTLQHRKRLAAGISMMLVSTLMVAAGVVGVASRGGPTAPTAPREVVYSQFRDLLTQGQLRAVRFDEASARIYFDTLQGVDAGHQQQHGRVCCCCCCCCCVSIPLLQPCHYQHMHNHI